MRLNALCMLAASIDFSARKPPAYKAGIRSLTTMVQEVRFIGLLLLDRDLQTSGGIGWTPRIIKCGGILIRSYYQYLKHILSNHYLLLATYYSLI